MIRKALLTTAAAVFMMALSSVARADTIVFGPGQFGSTATVTGFSLVNNGTNQTFTFTVTNTSSTGSLTAIGFNLPGTNRGTFTLNSTTDSDFKLANAVNATAGAQGGTFDFAMLTGKTYGGGKVSEGIGTTGSATFTITGNFSGLTAEQIVSAMFLRFQGIGPRDESEVIGPNPNTPVPEPMTMLLFGTGLAGVAARVRRRRNGGKA